MELLVILCAVCLQIFLTYKKLAPFLSLLIISIFAGFLLGMTPAQIIQSFEKGVGNTMGGLALVIFLGAVLGKILESGGATGKIASTLIDAFGERRIQWAVMLTGFLIGIPLYYNAGFVILVPLVFSISRKANLPLLYVAIPMAASLSTTHCFLPPHPSPIFLANAFQADIGKTLVLGLIITIPTVIIAGPLLGRILKNVASSSTTSFFTATEDPSRPTPAAAPSFLIGLLPVILIAIAVIAEAVLPGSSVNAIAQFIGNPVIALLIAALVAIWYFGIRAGQGMDATMKWLNEAIAGIAGIVLIITCGGVFKQILQDSGTDEHIAAISSQWQMPPLVFGWMITALLRVSIGSATVAGITAAGVVSPLVASGAVSPELMVLAVGTGSVFGSHVNDSGFWMFKEFFRLSLKQTFLSWSVMETLISILGLAGVLILDIFV
ncbi:gluconate:H+ symporter [Terrimonas sp. NA20]|uniref:Gluconate:H+ symporter n=1 Tax=Terrimonas ginsenosidimutans TaxID=2908004 RepID=A0ABS9KV71_9BACT|nr:gluconate:H+ symporter [Terrimonas ginsenosidimutans]MCG2616221.1 gluconate:H+ symporter [Terrimonas ginsenosidimutans]